MPLTRTEAEIRDRLAQNLDLIEAGLTLVDKEVFASKRQWRPRIFRHLYRTTDGKFVIEVKRSHATSREATQELVKYAALLRQNMLVKASELRLMVASTSWRELLVPFSEFARTAPYDCQGLRLMLGEEGLTERTELGRIGQQADRG